MLMKRYIILALVATMFAGCVNDMTQDVDMSVGAKKFYATLTSVESRVQLNSEKETVWTKGDEIIVFTDNNKIYRASFDGETGDQKGSFTTTKTYTCSNEISEPYAVYASDATELQLVRWNDNQVGPAVTIPTTQNYLKDSYASNTNVMIGTTTDGTNFKFKNVLSYLRLGLTGNQRVRSLTIESNAGEAITGNIALRLDNCDYFMYYQHSSSTVTIDCGTGVQLSATPTYFYAAITPTTLSEGFTATIELEDGTTLSQTTNKSIVIERNCIYPMATIATAINESDYKNIYIHHTAKSFMAPYIEAMNSVIDWGDGNTSSIDKYLTYDYLDNATSHIITIKAVKPRIISIPSMKGVTKLDFSNL